MDSNVPSVAQGHLRTKREREGGRERERELKNFVSILQGSEREREPIRRNLTYFFTTSLSYRPAARSGLSDGSQLQRQDSARGACARDGHNPGPQPAPRSTADRGVAGKPLLQHPLQRWSGRHLRHSECRQQLRPDRFC